MNKIPFRELCGKSIVGSMGKVIGKVTDVIFDENTGRIISLDHEPVEKDQISSSEECYRLIPFKIVLGVRDVVVIDESKMNSIKIISKEEEE